MEIISGNMVDSADVSTFPTPNAQTCWIKRDLPKENLSKVPKKRILALKESIVSRERGYHILLRQTAPEY